MAEFTPSSSTNPCGVCNRGAHGAEKQGTDCRLMSDGRWLCHSEFGEGLKPGEPAPKKAPYRFLSTSDEAQGFGIWKPEADWEERTTTRGPMPARLPAEWQATDTSTKSTSKRTAMAEVTLTTKLVRPEDTNNFHYRKWDGTPVAPIHFREDFGDGKAKFIDWRPKLTSSGLKQVDLAPYRWHEFLDHHQQHGGPVLVSKGELKVEWAAAIGLQAISILGWDGRIAAALKPLGADVVLVPDCDLADLQGWYAKACKALPQARHLLTPGANWAEPPEKGGVGLDDWLQTHLDSVTPNTASDLLAAITDQPWGEQDDEDLPTFNELLGQLVAALKAGDVNEEMRLRGNLSSPRFGRRTDAQIDARVLRYVRYQELGLDPEAPPPPPPDSVDMVEEEGMSYLVEGFIPRKDASMMVGRQGGGKTSLALGLSKATIEGTGFLDRSQKTERGTVLYIASDSGTAPLKKDLQDLDMLDGPEYKPGPQQQFLVWAHSRKSQTEAWSASIRDLLRLLEMVKRRPIALTVMDAMKKICSLGGISYGNNEVVLEWLAFIREVICQYTAVLILNHDGADGPLSHAGAKSWGEQVSTVMHVKKDESEGGDSSYRTLTISKGRMGDERTLQYKLEEGGLSVCDGIEIVGNCEGAILKFLGDQAKKKIATVSKKSIVASVCSMKGADGKAISPKTVDNTLSVMVKKSPPTIVRRARGKAKGFYSLTSHQLFLLAGITAFDDEPDAADAQDPASGDGQQVAAAGPSQPVNQVEEIPSPPKKASGNGNTHIKKEVIERVLVTSRPLPSGNSSGTPSSHLWEGEVFPTVSHREVTGNTGEASTEQGSALVTSREKGCLYREPADSGPESWQPITFASHRGDQIPDGLAAGDLVRSPSGGTEYELGTPTSNNSWQATTGKLIPIGKGWQVRRSQPATAPPAPPTPASTAIPPVGTAIELAGPANTWKPGYLLESVGLSQVRLTPAGPEVGKNRISRALADLGNTWRAAA